MTRLRYPLPTLHEVRYHTPCKARFRLVVSLYREGVEPSGFHRKVSIYDIGLPFPRLSLAQSPRGFERNSGAILVTSGGALPARAPRHPRHQLAS